MQIIYQRFQIRYGSNAICAWNGGAWLMAGEKTTYRWHGFVGWTPIIHTSTSAAKWSCAEVKSLTFQWPSTASLAPKPTPSCSSLSLVSSNMLPIKTWSLWHRDVIGCCCRVSSAHQSRHAAAHWCCGGDWQDESGMASQDWQRWRREAQLVGKSGTLCEASPPTHSFFTTIRCTRQPTPSWASTACGAMRLLDVRLR